MSDKSRLLVFANSSDDDFAKFNNSISSVLEPNKYTIENVQRNQLTLDNLNEKCAALFILDCERSLDDECREIVAKYVFGPANGKAMLFCDLNRNAADQLWLLNKGFKENRSIPDVVDLFQKFVKREDIPINRQAVQLTGVDSDDEFTVALARVENAVEYLCASAESGSEAVFVASTAENALRQTKAVWSDLATALNLDTLSVKPQPQVQSLAATPETVYVYTGRLGEDVERFEKFDEAVKLLLKPNSFKYSHLDQNRLSSDINLAKICKALLMAPASNQDFNDKSRKNLLNYFAGGGKVMFFGDFKTDTDWLWFLKYSFKDEQLARIIGAFEKFVKGDRLPTNLQALQMPTDGKIVNEYAVAFIRVENVIPLLYLSCENGSTAAFAAASPENVMEQNLTVWKDLLRVVDVIIVPGQDHRFTLGRMLSRIEYDNVRKCSPNLFVYNGAQEDPKEFEKFYNVFKTALRRDSYAVYPLSHQFISAMPWITYCRALFVSTEKSGQINADVRRMMEQYFKEGGKLMFFCDLKSDPEALWFLKSAITDEKFAKDVFDGFQRFDRTGMMPCNLTGKQIVKGADKNVEQYLAMMKIENAVSVLYLATETGSTVAFAAGDPEAMLKQNAEVWKDILRVLDLDVSTNVQPALTSGYLMCKDQDWQSRAFDLLKSPSETSQDILFIKTSTQSDSPTFPLRLTETHKEFDREEYFKNLRTKSLGYVSVFIPVARSILPVALSLHSLAPSLDTVIIAQQQTAGEGGYKKQWISPPGAALFSFVMKIPQNSNLGSNISFMNQLATAAVVEGIKSTAVYNEAMKGSEFSVGIKWPNDVYIGKEVKIGGVISSAVQCQSDFVVTVGVGVNVSNHRPTACLNDFLPENVNHFKVETIIAAILNQIETTIVDAQSKGLKNTIACFENNCVNMNQEVVLFKTKEQGVVIGIDENGHLKVKLNDGRVVPVTFDSSLDLRLNCFDCLIKV